jgi:hypothetical protein
VKREPGINRSGQEGSAYTTTDTQIKREPGRDHSNIQTSATTEQAPARSSRHDETHTQFGPATNERSEKRKAMEDELKAVELEQKRIRLTQVLAEMKSSD